MREKLRFLATRRELKILGGKMRSGVDTGLEVEHALEWKKPKKGKIPRTFLTTILRKKDRKFHFDGSGPAEWHYGVYKSPIWMMKQWHNETIYNEEKEATWTWECNTKWHGLWMAHGSHWHFSPTESAKNKVGEWRAWQIIWNSLVDLVPIFAPLMLYGDRKKAKVEGKFVARRELSQWAQPQRTRFQSPAEIREAIVHSRPPFDVSCRKDITGNPAGGEQEIFYLPSGEEWSGPYRSYTTARGITWQIPESLKTRKVKKENTTIELRYAEAHPSMAFAGLRIFQRILKKCIDRNAPIKVKPSFRDNLLRIRKGILNREKDVYEILKNSGPIQFEREPPTSYGMPGLKKDWYPNAWKILKKWLEQAYMHRNRYQHRVMWLIMHEGTPVLNAEGMFKINEHNLRWPEFPEVNLEVTRYHGVR